MIRLGILTAAVQMLVVAGSRADIESGPKPGDKAAALKVYGVVGAVEGKEADFTAERQDAPTIYVFVQSEHFSRPTARFLKALDGRVAKADESAAVVAVWVGDEAAFDKNKVYLPKAQMALQFDKTSLAAFGGGQSGPDGWGINPDAHLTAVVVRKGKVVKSFAFTSVNETAAPVVLAELGK